MAYAPALNVEGSDQEGLLEEPARPAFSWVPKRGLLATLGFATAGAALLWLGRTSPRPQMPLAFVDGAMQLDAMDANDPCRKYPFIDLKEVLHKNLGNQGPDTGDEGLKYKAAYYKPGEQHEDLILVVNASAAYKAGHAKYNGIHGKYGLITLRSGNEAEFTFKILDAATGKPKTLAKQEFTFFDLDQSAGDLNREYIEVDHPSNMWLTKNTEIQVSTVGSGKTKFMSSVKGSGSDNPKDPLALTVQQKNRAVTVEFKDFSELKVTLGCTPGRHARYFMFVIRPTLLCAKTVGSVDKGGDEVVTVTTTTGAPTAAPAPAGKEVAKKDCLATIPLINFCVPKAWAFWKR